jgi:chaperonin GroES
MKPLRNMVYMELDERPEQTNTGIFISKSWEDTIVTGTVKAIGPEVKSVKVGDRVMFNPYAYLDILDDERHKLIPEIDILSHV